MPDPGLVTPYVQQWNLSVQRAIKDVKIEVRYVGVHGTKAIRGFDYNQVIIKDILPDFIKAQYNGLVAQRATGAFYPVYNANLAGSQPIPFFNQLSSGGLLTNPTIVNLIQTGQVGELASTYQSNGLNGNVNFFPNPNILGGNILTNYSNSTYNGLQFDITRSFANGFQIQGNYVYSKVMGDAQGNQQTNFEPFLDINNAKIERSRASDFDITHVMKMNGSYELPFGPGRKYNFSNPVVRRLTEGWGIGAIMTKQSGTPFSVLSARGTFNRSARSANMTANTNLNKEQLDQLFQLNMTGNGPFFVPLGVKDPNNANRAVAVDGAAPFSGQVFFQPTAGSIGGLQRNYFSGPWVFNLDLSAGKTTRLTETKSLELRVLSTNALNHTTWFVGDQNLTSSTFGKITSTFYGRQLVQLELRFKF